MGVPWGEMKGVEHSEADPKVAALDMSELELELKFASFWAPPPAWTPPGWLRRCRGSADPELCLDLIIGGTGVDLGARSDAKGQYRNFITSSQVWDLATISCVGF